MLVKVVTASPFMPNDNNMALFDCDSIEIKWTIAEPDTDSPEDWQRYESFIDEFHHDGDDFRPAVPMDIEVNLDEGRKIFYITRREGNATIYIMDDSGKTIDKRVFNWNELAEKLRDANS